MVTSHAGESSEAASEPNNGDSSQQKSQVSLLTSNLNFKPSIKLNHINYNFWRLQVLYVVRAFNLEDFVLNSSKCPLKFIQVRRTDSSEVEQSPNEEYLSWKKTNQLLASSNFLQEVQFLLMSYKSKLAQHNVVMSLDMNQAQAHYSNFRGNNMRGRGRGRNRGGSRFVCQLCGKTCHVFVLCYKRFDQAFQGLNLQSMQSQSQQRTNNNNPSFNGGPGNYQAHMSQYLPNFLDQMPGYYDNNVNLMQGYSGSNVNPNAFIASPNTVIDPSWYVASGATNHITADMNNITQKSNYRGNEKLSVGLEHVLIQCLIEFRSFRLLIHKVSSPNVLTMPLYVLLRCVDFIDDFRDDFSTVFQSCIVVIMRERVTVCNPKMDSNSKFGRPRYWPTNRGSAREDSPGRRPQGLAVVEAVGPTAWSSLCSRVGHAPPMARG
ncbi:hypothetical protein Q3G72_014911 [Acer saccharum]|nr:hypothetical protein Q3G72_014911 [Acer saccharum]